MPRRSVHREARDHPFVAFTPQVIGTRTGILSDMSIRRVSGVPIPYLICHGPIEVGQTVAWHDGVEWSPGGAASAILMPSGHNRPAHPACCPGPNPIDSGIRAALAAGFQPERA